jgi:hypothetical protein
MGALGMTICTYHIAFIDFFLKVFECLHPSLLSYGEKFLFSVTMVVLHDPRTVLNVAVEAGAHFPAINDFDCFQISFLYPHSMPRAIRMIVLETVFRSSVIASPANSLAFSVVNVVTLSDAQFNFHREDITG